MITYSNNDVLVTSDGGWLYLPSYYDITVSSSTKGTTVASKYTVLPGETVTLTETRNPPFKEGMNLMSWHGWLFDGFHITYQGKINRWSYQTGPINPPNTCILKGNTFVTDEYPMIVTPYYHDTAMRIYVKLNDVAANNNIAFKDLLDQDGNRITVDGIEITNPDGWSQQLTSSTVESFNNGNAISPLNVQIVGAYVNKVTFYCAAPYGVKSISLGMTPNSSASSKTMDFTVEERCELTNLESGPHTIYNSFIHKELSAVAIANQTASLCHDLTDTSTVTINGLEWMTHDLDVYDGFNGGILRYNDFYSKGLSCFYTPYGLERIMSQLPGWRLPTSSELYSVIDDPNLNLNNKSYIFQNQRIYPSQVGKSNEFIGNDGWGAEYNQSNVSGEWYKGSARNDDYCTVRLVKDTSSGT